MVGADLQLAGDQGTDFGASAAAATAAGDRLDPRHHLLWMARLADPVVDAEPQPSNPLGDRGATGADDHAEVRQHPADPLEVAPGFVAKHRQVDQQRIQLHRHQLLGWDRAAQHALLPARCLGALREHGDETAVVVDHREANGLLCVQVAALSMARWTARRIETARLYAPAAAVVGWKFPAFTGFSQLRRHLPALSDLFPLGPEAPNPSMLSLNVHLGVARPRQTSRLTRLLSRHRERPTAPGRSLFSGSCRRARALDWRA